MSLTKKQFPTKRLHVVKTHDGSVNAVCFSNLTGTYLLTGSSDRSIHLSRAIPSSHSGRKTTTAVRVTNAPIQKYNEHAYDVLDLAVSADNARFASVGGDKKVFLWDVEQGVTLRRWLGHEGRVEAVEFGGVDDSVVVSGSADSTVKIWDARSQSTKPIQTLTEARDTVSSLHVHPATATIVSGSYDGRARNYDLRIGRATTDILCVTGGGAVTSVRCSDDGQAVLASCLDSKIRLLDRSNGNVLRGFGGSSSSATSVISLDVADDNATTSSTHTPQPVVSYRNDRLRMRSALAMGDGVVISGGESSASSEGGVPKEGHVFAWDVLTGNMIASTGMGSSVKAASCVAWNEGSQCWAAGCSDGSVQVECQMQYGMVDCGNEIKGNNRLLMEEEYNQETEPVLMFGIFIVSTYAEI
ncbi:hypothetical protein KEM54_001359 [Ascosphaera aggregata]|nr:hypothetical protein KEM54_001359 [Ascosphaera aggregata]